MLKYYIYKSSDGHMIKLLYSFTRNGLHYYTPVAGLNDMSKKWFKEYMQYPEASIWSSKPPSSTIVPFDRDPRITLRPKNKPGDQCGG